MSWTRQLLAMTPGGVIAVALLLALLQSCAAAPVEEQPVDSSSLYFPLRYQVDLRRPGGSFQVSMFVDGLPPGVDRFRLIGGGALANQHYGRYVTDIAAFDAAGRTIAMQPLAEGEWRITRPRRVRRIRYSIRETWPAQPGSGGAIEMIGSSRGDHYAFITGRAVFGCFVGMEQYPAQLTVDLPETWQLATSLRQDHAGALLAGSYREMVSSPILAGELSMMDERILGTDVAIAVHSISGEILAEDLVETVDEILTATYNFLGFLPIEDYTMLFLFDDRNAGGVEYHNSAVFLFGDRELDELRQRIRDVVAHEFFHLLIPFSLRSDALEGVDGQKPAATGHLWFIEGVTEWASDKLQIQAGLKPPEEYWYRDFRGKLIEEEIRTPGSSLYFMSRDPGRSLNDYLSVYSRGAVAASLLDIQLLHYSYGKRGLRDVLLDLHHDYGKQRPLPEDRFFEILTDYSGPETADFIESYIVGHQPLPVAETLAMIGMKYYPQRDLQNGESDIGMVLGYDSGLVRILWAPPAAIEMGFRVGDGVESINEVRLTRGRLQRQLREATGSLSIGDDYQMQVLREGGKMTLNGRMLPKTIRHMLEQPRRITPRQHQIRSAWMYQDQ